MRITTANNYANSIASMQAQQQALDSAQQQISTGLRVAVPGDDPIAAARAERALATMVGNEADQRALQASQNMTTQVESALGSATDLLQQARSLVTQAGDGSLGPSDYGSIATQLQSIRGQLLAVANSTDGAGSYLFGGQGSKSPPLVDGSGGVSYQGTPGQATIQGSQAMPMGMDGNQVWLQAPNPGGGAPLSPFGVLDGMISSLQAAATSTSTAAKPVVAAAVTTGLSGLDAVAANISAARSSAGGALNSLNSVSTQLQQSTLSAQTTQSNAIDMDMVKGISTVQKLQTNYQAALQSYASIQKISLFNYISA
ncbi:MAG: flagellar hook-associated protein FlgL [Burkholderiales bacterium]|nr:flagellar hook-associated protein FlgL [Burkholderiales bacterium]MDE2394330.1 flagellar hook-associated protein FlgL [Burkholderiales bacterium]MDE2452482.1 flagellar hook-associated protein FlgL [Burkholderiales bacterium]